MDTWTSRNKLSLRLPGIVTPDGYYNMAWFIKWGYEDE